eukprot:scaffold624_cov206-Alexandrium_tamarense.AAC.15
MINENDHEDVLDDIEAEMDNDIDNDEMDFLASTLNSASVSSSSSAAINHISTTSLPSHQANHAAEFWFPECRDCTCCNGFKHGCGCGGLCVCSGGKKKVDVTGGHQNANAFVPAGTNTTHGGNQYGGGGRGYNDRGYGAGGRGSGGGGGGGKTPCKFFQMGSCRFGDTCRFSHS